MYKIRKTKCIKIEKQSREKLCYKFNNPKVENFLHFEMVLYYNNEKEGVLYAKIR